jgi:hypothetical protein
MNKDVDQTYFFPYVFSSSHFFLPIFFGGMNIHKPQRFLVFPRDSIFAGGEASESGTAKVQASAAARLDLVVS